ncbi:hypothetical protein N5P37_001923 [Trichoderma harzianum]|uniref:Uncharacterized protein n=1 Tax=Trichoderma harzianum CBS 226.95 TaxID=983964 RepID=A0A2T4APK2_TRIHA|nr:hypothetical protein M431DRAFT_478134 [Trichoderma harzianum CBS 226.95]KAK0765982.1 hypothetical protein N5P37_001923 [Trichoderma harzianum]PTB59001.1 hypothetical protein M431DRAFT_478134 [Trichoderma harzianum CBS 226.95]
MEVSRQIRTSEEDETKGISLRHLVETRRTQQDGLGLLPAAYNHKLYDAAAVANIFLPGWRSKVLAPDHGCRTKEIKISERTVSGAPANLRALNDPKYGRRWRLREPRAGELQLARIPGDSGVGQAQFTAGWANPSRKQLALGPWSFGCCLRGGFCSARERPSAGVATGGAP